MPEQRDGSGKVYFGDRKSLYFSGRWRYSKADGSSKAVFGKEIQLCLKGIIY